MAKDRARDETRKLPDMGKALGWTRDASAWADAIQPGGWPQNAIKTERPHDNSSINKHHDGDWRKDRNEVYNVGGGHVYSHEPREDKRAKTRLG